MEQEITLNAHNEAEPPSIEDLKKSTNPIHRDFFAENILVKEWAKDRKLFKTKWINKHSDNSFCLKDENVYKSGIPDILIERFGIKDKVVFLQKYHEAIAGDGQEWKRITTLHSSSLLALLCFYSVSKENPIEINGYTFTESYFEVKTQVYEDSESNMDVVLRGTKEGKKVILFLESKFSEYLNCGKYDDIRYEAYHETYESLKLFENQLECLMTEVTEKKNKDNTTSKQVICIKPSNQKMPMYCGGIKQMISHYMGVNNYQQKGENALGHSRLKHDAEEQILLGEILFDFKDSPISHSKDKMDNYQSAYKSLAQRVNAQGAIKMFEELLTYQEIFKHNEKYLKQLAPNITRFYGLQ